MKIFLIIIAIILYFPVHAQNSGIISGEVIDSQDNSPIFSAVITIIDKQIRKTQAETDPLGKFEIKNINPGKYNVKISTSGYEPVLLTQLIVSENKRTKYSSI